MPLFGRSKKAAKPAAPKASTADTIRSLQGTMQLLEKKETQYERKINEQMKAARTKTAAKDKRGALMCLKRKKMYEGEIAKCSAARMNLEHQIMTLESAQLNKEAFMAMKTGAAGMQQIHGEMNVDSVEETMDEIQEQMDVANEISEALTNPLGGMMADEDDLMAELEEMEGQMMEEQFLDTALPEAPTAAPAVAAPTEAAPAQMDAEEAAALRELEMAM
eukprot:TRINITY_DN773125_c0_g1_i1.p1 TRINITY_DN773125_c0_g1~~TRINITY_DN773125_c0_g1_i1.p1  ORF type:complete len:220 (-),score=106.33 TRINITY_DN773125_c0_g1_i1:257-916(-)